MVYPYATVISMIFTKKHMPNQRAWLRILENNDFRVDINEDNLRARIEDHDMPHMQKRLEILGYLTLHTRQIDMIMNNPSRVHFYKAKIAKDIQTLLSAT